MKKLLLITLLFSASFVAVAQEETQEETQEEVQENNNYRPKKGSYTVSILMGRGNHINEGSTYIGSSFAVSGQAPSVNTISTNDNSVVNMAGVEGKYFIEDKMAISLTGAFTFRSTPSAVNIPSVTDASGVTVMPGYNSVIGEDRYDAHLAVGLQWYLKLKSPKLIPYVGFSLPFDYARTSTFDPTVNLNGNTVPLGLKHIELFGIGVQGVAGLDYYLSEDLFIGFDVKPLSYNYVMNSKKPQAGAIGRRAKNSTLSFFGQYFFKIGFKLN